MSEASQRSQALLEALDADTLARFKELVDESQSREATQPDDLRQVWRLMGCGNCGSPSTAIRCTDVTRDEHTHPRSYKDMTQVPCRMWLCRHCESQLRKNLRRRPT